MHRLGIEALSPPDRLAVDGELEDVVGQRLAAAQLGVDGLVAPQAEPGCPRDSLQEVGPPAPTVGHEGSLVDDLGACAAWRDR